MKEQYDQRTEAVNRDALAFTRAHKSFSLLYGLSSFLGLGSMFASGPDFDFNSYAIGPLTFRFNRAVSENVSINYGPSFLYYKQNIRVSGYRTDTHLLFGAFELGINYHFTSTTKIDPYIGIGSGVGYFYTISDDYDGPLSGTIPVLYSAKVGMNTISKSNHAWTFELAYDYLAYFKVGYTFIKHR